MQAGAEEWCPQRPVTPGPNDQSSTPRNQEMEGGNCFLLCQQEVKSHLIRQFLRSPELNYLVSGLTPPASDTNKLTISWSSRLGLCHGGQSTAWFPKSYRHEHGGVDAQEKQEGGLRHLSLRIGFSKALIRGNRFRRISTALRT